jgi:diacylglycerol kinase (ATP)
VPPVSAPGRLAVVVNPAAGGGRGARGAQALAALSRRLAGSRLEVVDVSSDSAEHAAARAREAVRDGARALVVVGGDGMVHLGAGVVAGTDVPLGVLPAGTGNDVARSLGIPVDDPAAALDLLVAALTQDACVAIDAVRAQAPATGGAPARSRWFAGVMGAGFDAVVNERANGWRRPRGRLRYPLATARELPVFRPRPYELTLDDGPVERTRAMLVTVANTPSYGGGMRVCPQARPDDGLLDVLVLEPVSRAELVRFLPSVYSGGHVDHPKVSIRRARSVRVSAPDIVAYADGERVGPLPLTCTVVPGALRVLAPPRPT